MSADFATALAIYYIAQTDAQSAAACREIEQRLAGITDSMEWFAAAMCLEVVRGRRPAAVQWIAPRVEE